MAAVVADPRRRTDGPSRRRDPAAIVVDGPRTALAQRRYALVVEAVYEGYLLHYGGARIVRTADADLALLAGDQLYALGLARLVALGDLDGVRELADVISLTALAQAAGDPELAAAVWRAGARADRLRGRCRRTSAPRSSCARGAPGAAAAARGGLSEPPGRRAAPVVIV